MVGTKNCVVGVSIDDCRPEGELVQWSTTGSMLIVQYQKTINVYSTVRKSFLVLMISPDSLQETGTPTYTGTRVAYSRCQIRAES